MFKDLDLDSAVSEYFTTLKDILDEPITERVVKYIRDFLVSDLMSEIFKYMTRKLKHKYLKFLSTADSETWFKQENFHEGLCRKKRKEFWDSK